MTPEELHRRAVERLEQRQAEHLAQAARLRADQTAALAAGERSTGAAIGVLAAHREQSAALAGAEQQDRAVRFAKALAMAQCTARHRDSAKHDRPGRRSALRELMDDMMKAERCADFKTFLRRWESESLGGLGLRAIDDGKRYTVNDESGDAGSRTYAAGTLERLYSEAGEK